MADEVVQVQPTTSLQHPRARCCGILFARAPTARSRDLRARVPAGLDWLNVAFLRMNTLMGRGAVLVEFWDFARVNSLRTLPYLMDWHERYREAGLRMIGVHSPGYSFGRDRDTVARAVERLEVPYAVAARPGLRGLAPVREQGLAGPLPLRPDRQAGATCTTARASTWTPSCAIRECLGIDVEPMAPVRARGRSRRPARAADRRHRAARRPRAARAGARLGRRRGLDRGRRRRRGRELQFQRGRGLRGAVGGRRWSRGSTRWTGRSRRSRPDCASTACSSRLAPPAPS